MKLTADQCFLYDLGANGTQTLSYSSAIRRYSYAFVAFNLQRKIEANL